MNERIRQLVRQAGLDDADFPIENWDNVPLAKFAELIVKECMHECLRMQLGNQYTPEELLFQTKYRKIIKEHFGVEE
jgi:hypothetical protein